MERLVFGGAYLWIAIQLEVNLPFLLRFSLYLRTIFQVQAPRGLYLEGRFNGGFFALPVKGAYIWRGLVSKFTVCNKIEDKEKVRTTANCSHRF